MKVTRRRGGAHRARDEGDGRDNCTVRMFSILTVLWARFKRVF
jgi:hypothetical protein